MGRKGVPCCGDCKGLFCSLKQKLDWLTTKTQNAYAKLNGVYPDGTQNLQITGSNGVHVQTIDGNHIDISKDPDEVGIATINGTQPDTACDFAITGDSHITVTLQTNGIEIGVTGLATSIELSNVIDGTTPVQEAAHAGAADNQTNATNANHQTTADSATNATHQTSADSQTTAGSATNANHQTTADSATNANHQTAADSQTTATSATYLGSNSSNVGSDQNPVKIVNGQAVQIGRDVPVLEDLSSTVTLNGFSAGRFGVFRYGKLVHIEIQAGTITAAGNDWQIISGLPKAASSGFLCVQDWTQPSYSGVLLAIYTGETVVRKYSTNTVSNIYQSFEYICE